LVAGEKNGRSGGEAGLAGKARGSCAREGGRGCFSSRDRTGLAGVGIGFSALGRSGEELTLIIRGEVYKGEPEWSVYARRGGFW